MQNITSIAASRLAAQQRALDVTADNIANAGTPGYKAVRIQFSDWLSRQHGTATPRGGAALLLGIRPIATLEGLLFSAGERADYIRPLPRARPSGHGELLKPFRVPARPVLIGHGE